MELDELITPSNVITKWTGLQISVEEPPEYPLAPTTVEWNSIQKEVINLMTAREAEFTIGVDMALNNDNDMTVTRKTFV